jgi:hypothetical protein
MKNSIIWITAGVAAIGFGVPAFAANGDSPSDIAPTRVTVATTTQVTAPDDSVTTNSVDDSVTTNSVDDNTTVNSVEDISGPCDEAEHATDPRCTGAASSTEDNSGHDSNDDNSGDDGTDDNSGHNSSDDNSGHDGGDDSGHGGSDD